MTRAERWLFHASNVLVAGTGGVYAWMLYALEPADDYALGNHELQPTFQHLHVWFAPLLVLMAGVLWRAHVAPQLRSQRRARRRSGIALLALLLPMVLSGYSIQVVSEQAWRDTWVIVHVASSALWCVAMLVHLIARSRAPRSVDARPVAAQPEVSTS